MSKVATETAPPATPPGPPIDRKRRDPVTRYARAVLGRRVLVGRPVHQAAERHMRDLARENTIEFPYYFDSYSAQHLIDFFPGFLTLEDGSEFNLTPWLQFCFGSIFGWKRMRDHGRRFQLAYIETGKGSGKTPSLAGVGIYGLRFDEELAAEIYAAAFDQAQAMILLNHAIRMAAADEELALDLTIGTYNIAHDESMSFFRAISSEHRGQSGPKPHMGLIDELHEHRDGQVLMKVKAGFKNRRQPLLLIITNSGHDRTSVCWEYHFKALQVLDRVLDDEEFFGYVCQLDPCEEHRLEGYRQPVDGCLVCDSWTDPKVWPKVNPSLGITIQPEYLEKQVRDAQSMPSEMGLVKRLNFCLWTETAEVWIPADSFEACRARDAEGNPLPVSSANPDGRPCAAGLDLSAKWDLTGLTVAIRHDDPPVAEDAPKPEEVTIDGMDDAGQPAKFKFTLDFVVELVPFCWIPRDTLIERVDKERIPYDVWERNHHVQVTPGGVIDHQAIYDFIVTDAWKRFRIQRLGYDERDATMFAVKLRDEARFGEKIVAVGQGKKLSEALKLIMLLVRARRLRHDGHPVQAWCFANAEPHRDRLGAIWIDKGNELKRIDLAISAAMAIHQLMLLPPKRQRAPAVTVI